MLGAREQEMAHITLTDFLLESKLFASLWSGDC
jgi:hypothetical protein